MAVLRFWVNRAGWVRVPGLCYRHRYLDNFCPKLRCVNSYSLNLSGPLIGGVRAVALLTTIHCQSGWASLMVLGLRESDSMRVAPS